MFHAYMLRCADNSYYTGHTDDLETRIGQHQSGVVRGYTFDRRPVELVWSDNFPTREEALTAELRIKSWSRAKKEALIAGEWERMAHASVPPSERSARQASAPLGTAPRLRSGRTEDRPPPPAIILVRPQLGENIGKAARAMLNFGLTELRLVAPRDRWPNPAAGPAASGADIVLERATVFDTLEHAVADCTHVYATTVRRRGLVKPVVTPEAAARAIAAEPGRSAILFGPERSGLETDDVAMARTILTVPINPDFSSLNLAQAVVLVAYEWSKHAADAGVLQSPTDLPLDPPAGQADLDGLVAHLEAMLEPENYFYPPDRATATRRTLRSVLTKPGWNANEIRTLRGVLSALEGRRQRRSKASSS